MTTASRLSLYCPRGGDSSGEPVLTTPECRPDPHIHAYLLVSICWKKKKKHLGQVPSDPTRFADGFGRKTSFYVAWLWLVVVSYAS